MNAAGPRRWMFGLTADEWLHLAGEGHQSEVAPCCGDIGSLREWLNGLATAQGDGEATLYRTPLLDAYEAALGSHDALASRDSFPLLHRVLDAARKAEADWQAECARTRAEFAARAGHRDREV